MFITPKINANTRKLNHHPIRNQDYNALSKLLDRQITDEDCNLIFETDIYMKNVFTTREQIEDVIYHKNDEYNNGKYWIIGLVGLAGAGHYTPAYQMARALQNEYNVMLLDPIMLCNPKIAYQNSEAWNTIARYTPDLWRIVREFMAHEKTSDLFYRISKVRKYDIYRLIEELDVYGIFSTFTFTNTIMPELSQLVEKSVIIIPDVSPVGFANVPYHKDYANDKVDYVVICEDSAIKMKQLYPSFVYQRERIHIAGNTPCFMDFPDPGYTPLPNTMLASLGSAVGIGSGIQIMPELLSHFEGTLILDLGSNQKWKQKAYEYLRHPKKPISCEVIFTGCLSTSLYEELFRRCEITLEKCGGSAGSQSACKKGITGVANSIKGQEEDNEQHWKELGAISLIKNKKQLRKFLKDRPETPGLSTILKRSKSAIDIALEAFQN